MIYEYLNKIFSICCEEFDVKIEEAKSKSRRQEIIFCRKAFCLIVKEKFDLKNELPAKILGKSHQYASRYLKYQPNNNYYLIIVERIRKRLINELQIS